MSDTSANAVAFVRTESVPASAPPVNAAGPVKWLKDNLFDGVGNSFRERQSKPARQRSA